MANVQSEVVTLVASTVSTVTLAGLSHVAEIVVVNMDGADTVTFDYDINGTVPANPTAEADDLPTLPAVAGYPWTVPMRARTSGDVTVKLISAGTPKVEVLAYP